MTTKKGSRKSVLQIDKKTDVVIAVWESESIAATELNIDQGNLSKAARGKRKSSGGFKWDMNLGNTTPSS